MMKPRLIRYITLWGCFLGMLCPGSLFADDSETKESQAKVINVLELQPGWWNSITKQEASLREQTFNALTQHLQNLKKQSQELEGSEEVQSLIQRSSNNLEVYQKRFAEKTIVETPPVAVFLESYTLTQIQELLTHQHQQTQNLQLFQKELDQLQAQLSDLEKSYNNTMATYLELEGSGTEKLTSGLKILVSQLSKAILNLRMEQHQDQIKKASSELKNLEEELVYAKKHFQIVNKDQLQIQKRILDLEAALQSQLKTTLKLEKTALDASRETPLEQAKANLFQYEWVHASVNEAGIQIELLQEKVREQLALLQLDADKVSVQEIQQKVTEWDMSLSDIRQSMETWNSQIQQASQSASVALSNLTDVPSKQLKQIHQKQLNLSEKAALDIKTIQNEEVVLDSLLRWLEEENDKRQQSIQKVFSYGHYAMVASWDQVYEWMEQSLFTIGEIPVTPFGIIRVFIILLMSILFSRLIRSSLKRTKRLGLSENSVYTVSRLLHYAILTIGLFIGLSSIGIDFSQFALIAGALSVGIGFGLQSIISNFVSGIILLFERPLKIGDLVELESGVKGNVKAINVRSTLIHTWDGIDVLVPNSEFIVGKVTNWTFQDPIRRLHVPFGVSYSSDKELVKKAALEAAARVEHTITPEPGKEPAVWLKGFGDNSIDFSLVVWVDPQRTKGNESLQALYLWELHTSLVQYEIEIPFPQRDLHLKSGFEALSS